MTDHSTGNADSGRALIAALPFLIAFILGILLMTPAHSFATQLVGSFDCSNLMPKLRSAPDFYDRDSVCRANSRMWASIYLLFAFYIVALVSFFIMKRNKLTFSRIMAMPKKPFIVVFFGFPGFIILGIFLFLNFTYSSRKGRRSLSWYGSADAYATYEIAYLAMALNALILFTMVVIALSFLNDGKKWPIAKNI